jgi:hypothetical protein
VKISFFSTIWRVLSRSKRATGVEKGVERPQASREENDKKVGSSNFELEKKSPREEEATRK